MFRATTTAHAADPGTGRNRTIRRGDMFEADDPMVETYPHMFEDLNSAPAPKREAKGRTEAKKAAAAKKKAAAKKAAAEKAAASKSGAETADAPPAGETADNPPDNGTDSENATSGD